MQPEFLADVVRDLIQESGISRSQIAQRAGIPSRTIGSWANGLVRRPRRWQDLVRFASGAQLSREQTNRLLRSAEYDDLATLQRTAATQDKALFAVWDSADVPFQIPRLDISQFFGREDECARINQVLTKGGQICVIQGMGGVGKSTLATAAARAVADYFPDGILWSNLRNTDTDTIIESWAQALDIELTAFTGTDSRAARMWSVFARRRMLIVFDDVVNAAEIKPLLPSRHTQCAVLVTTRRQAVANSLTAQPEHIINLMPLNAQDSALLLSEAAGQAADGVARETLDAICELLGHLPLAITIFGRNCRARRKPVAQMQERLVDIRSRLQHLRLGQDEAVYAAFEQTWEILDERNRTAFATLAVFDGQPFSAEAFAAIAECDLFSAEDCLDDLYALALLNVISDTPRRYRQHPLLAAFAHQKLNHREPVLRRFVTYYRQFVRVNATNYPALLTEWNNIRAGIESAHQLGESDALLEYVHLLRPIWFARGLYGDARQAYKWATLAVSDDATAAAIELAYGQAILEQSDFGAARQQLENSLQRFEALNDAHGSADAHYHLARVATDQDQLQQAEKELRAAWRDYQQVEHLPGLANVLYRQGRIAYLRGDYRETDALTIDSLKLQREVEDIRGELRSLNLLSLSAMEQKDLERAQFYCEAAVELSERLDDIDEQTSCYYSLANLQRLQEKFVQARVSAHRSLNASRETGSRATEANVLTLLALVEKDAHLNSESSDLELALQYAKEAVSVYDEIEFLRGRAAGLITLGLIQRELDQLAEAQMTWEDGLHLAESLSNQILISRYSELLATLQNRNL